MIDTTNHAYSPGAGHTGLCTECNNVELHAYHLPAPPTLKAVVDHTAKQCPTCNSPEPRRHPAMQYEGEVQLCTDKWHEPHQADSTRETAVSAAGANPASIDLDKLCTEAGWLSPVERVLAAAVEALRERVGELEVNYQRIFHTAVERQRRAETAEAQVAELETDNGAAIKWQQFYMKKAETSEAHTVEMAGALETVGEILEFYDGDQTTKKRGVPVIVINAEEPGGDLATLLLTIRTALATLPPQALERARARDKVVRQASELYTRLLVLQHVGKFIPPDRAVANEFVALGNCIAALDALDQEDGT